MSSVHVPIADLLVDPDPVLRAARERGAVATTDAGTLVVRHDAVRSTLQDPSLRPAFSVFLAQFGITSGPFHDWMSISPLDMEGEEHRVWRRLVLKAFTPRSVERLRPFLRAEADRLIDELPPDGQVDFVQAFARQLPSLGLCELIGVPQEGRTRFASWADTIGIGFNFALLPLHVADVDAALVKLLAYADELIAARREEPRDDLVTRLAEAAVEEGGVGEDVVRGTVAGLVFAGHETTKNQLGWMIHLLASAPAEWERVGREPEHAPAVVEEVLRLRSAATSVGRLATGDTEIHGCPVPAGSRVIASLWSANRDAAVFPRPDELDPEANGAGVQLAFGQGAHHCLGAALARAELQESLVALAARLHPPRLLPGATFAPTVGITGPMTLPVILERR